MLYLLMNNDQLDKMQDTGGFSSAELAELMKTELYAERWNLVQRRHEHMILFGYHVYSQAVAASATSFTPAGLQQAHVEWQTYRATTLPLLARLDHKIKVFDSRIEDIHAIIDEDLKDSPTDILISYEGDDDEVAPHYGTEPPVPKKMFCDPPDDHHNTSVQDIDLDDEVPPYLLCDETLSDDSEDDCNEMITESVKLAHKELLDDEMAQRDMHAHIDQWARAEYCAKF